MKELVFQFAASDGKKKNIRVQGFNENLTPLQAEQFLDQIAASAIVVRDGVVYHATPLSARIIDTETQYLVKREG